MSSSLRRWGWFAALLFGAVACSESEPSAPSPLAMRPAQGSQADTTAVVIDGLRFNPWVQVDYDDESRSAVSTAFGLWLGPHRLQQVRYVSSEELHAVVPAGLPSGGYDLTVVAPGGARGTLPDAFTVLPALDAGFEAGADGASDG